MADVAILRGPAMTPPEDLRLPSLPLLALRSLARGGRAMRPWVLAAMLVAGLAGSAGAAECAHFEAAETRIRAIIEGTPDNRGGQVRILAVQIHTARGPELGVKQCKVTVVTTAGDQHWELLENPTAGDGMIVQRDSAFAG